MIFTSYYHPKPTYTILVSNPNYLSTSPQHYPSPSLPLYSLFLHLSTSPRHYLSTSPCHYLSTSPRHYLSTSLRRSHHTYLSLLTFHFSLSHFSCSLLLHACLGSMYPELMAILWHSKWLTVGFRSGTPPTNSW